MNIQSILANSSLVLTECAISERIRRDTELELHPTLFLTPLIYTPQGSTRLTAIYDQYRNIAKQANLPILLCAPTWRIDKIRLEAAGYDETLLYDAVRFMRDLHGRWQNNNSPLILGGLLAPQNDCYTPSIAPPVKEALRFHRWQTERLVISGVDCIVAQTIPAVSEGLGIAQAISEFDTPYIISFVINQQGQVLDTTPLTDAIAYIDDNVALPPLGYMVNCVYPTFVCAEKQPQKLFDRLLGIQANSSSLDHSKLDDAAILYQDDLKHWGDTMLFLNERFGVKILGGCCGTDNTYMQYLVDHRNS